MTTKIVRIDFYVAVATLVLIGCVSSSKNSSLGVFTDFDKVQLGQDRKQVENLWGLADIGDEKYQSVVFKTLQYKEGRVFFTIDSSSNQVVSKSMYIDSSEPIYDLSVLEKRYFPNVAWETYVPCHKRSNRDRILINRRQGFYIATSDQNAAFVSWSTPAIIDLRVKLLYQHCPQRQPSDG